jgi:hypothetical protein
VIRFFLAAGVDLRALCDALDAEPQDWRDSYRSDLEIVRHAIRRDVLDPANRLTLAD